MVDDDEVWFMQVFNDSSKKAFWDCACWLRKPTDEKGVATFLDATPRLMWMSGKTLKEVWAYLTEMKKLKRLDFTFTKENERLLADLLTRPSDREDHHARPSAPLRSQRDRNR
jgi:hypothetical protein